MRWERVQVGVEEIVADNNARVSTWMTRKPRVLAFLADRSGCRHPSSPNRENSMMWLYQPTSRFTHHTFVALTRLSGSILLL